MNVSNVTPTVFNVATPSGRGAVATIILHGPEAPDYVNRLFRSRCGNPISHNQIGQIVYGNWTVDGQLGEDLIVCPRTDDCVEIHCHGGESAIQLIANTLVNVGAAPVEQLDIAARMAGNSYPAELILAISKAATRRTVKYLIAQPKLHQDLWRKISTSIYEQDSGVVKRLIEACLRWTKFGEHLTRPWSVVFCGSPNVGKSSVVNALLGFRRSIVHPVAGTTRDAIAEQTAIDGWPVQMFDTAGIRDTHDRIEQLGIETAEQSIRSANRICLVIDSSRFDRNELDKQIKDFNPALILANKSDLATCESPRVDIHVSAKTGSGMNQLITKISQILVPTIPELSQVIPVVESQVERLEIIRAAVGSGNWSLAEDYLNIA